MQTEKEIMNPWLLILCLLSCISDWQVLVHHLEIVAWSLPNISANHLFECLVTANIIFNLFTSFFAIHYYKTNKYACKNTITNSEKGTIFSKCLRGKQIIEYFAILFLGLIIIKYERKRLFWRFLNYNLHRDDINIISLDYTIKRQNRNKGTNGKAALS